MDASKLPITGPCPIDLDAIGFDRSAKSAHCTHCVKSVHNLSNMTAREARGFLKENAGDKVCVSYARQQDGKIRFKPEATVVPLSRLRARRPAAAAAALGFSAALAACTPVDNPDVARTPTEETERPESKHEDMYAGKMVVSEPEPEPVEEIVEGGLKLPEPEPIEEMAGEIEAVDPEPEVTEAPCFGEAKVPEAELSKLSKLSKPSEPSKVKPGKPGTRGLDPL